MVVLLYKTQFCRVQHIKFILLDHLVIQVVYHFIIDASDANNSAKGSFERHFNVVKIEEVGFTTRDYQLKILKSVPKSKNKQSIKKDKAIATIVNQHKKLLLVSYQTNIELTAQHSLPSRASSFSILNIMYLYVGALF